MWFAPLRTLYSKLGWRRTPQPLNKCKRILIIRPDEIGDVVMMSPFFRNLRKGAPRAEISVLTNPTCKPLLEECPYIDSLYSLPFRPSVDPRERANLVFSALQLKWVKGLGRFDLILLPRVDADWYNSELVAHILAGLSPVVLNSASFIHCTKHTPKGLQLADVRIVVSNPQSDVLSNLEFLERCGGCAQTKHLEFWISEEDSAAVKKWLSAHVAGARKMVFHPPGGRSHLRRWPAGRSSECVEKLLLGTDFSIIVVGGPEDEHCRQEFASLRHPRLKVALGEFSLTELGALIRACGYFVGGDSGPMHIAAAVGAQTIGIFGPGSEKRFGPWSPKSRVVTRREACSPDAVKSYEACCPNCIFEENQCLTKLIDDTVLEVVIDVMQTAKNQ